MPWHACETVDIKAMTAREEDILTSRAFIKKGTVITELIRSCLVDKRIDPNSLLSGDRNALMVAIRVTGYGVEYSTEVTCPVCDTYSFNVKDDVYMNKFQCCWKCYIQWVEDREDRWQSGWRPNNGNDT